MPLSKGGIVAVVVAVVIVVGVAIWAGVTFAPKASSSSSKKYKCNGSTCQEDPNGTYSDNTCGGNCTSSVTTYNCNSTTGQRSAVQDSSGTYATNDLCKASCKPASVTTYNCDSTTGQCSAVQDSSGTYATNDLCKASCVAPKYSCNGASCQLNPNGNFTDDNCGGHCTAVSSTWNCDPTLGCQSVPGNGGAYPDQPTCQSKCKQLQCNSSAGTCTATSTTYNDTDHCAQTCTPSNTCSG